MGGQNNNERATHRRLLGGKNTRQKGHHRTGTRRKHLLQRPRNQRIWKMETRSHIEEKTRRRNKRTSFQAKRLRHPGHSHRQTDNKNKGGHQEKKEIKN